MESKVLGNHMVSEDDGEENIGDSSLGSSFIDNSE